MKICLLSISCLLLSLTTFINLASAGIIEQAFHILPGTKEYLIAFRCPIDPVTGKRYKVFPTNIDPNITHIGEVHYDPKDGRATVSITATEPANLFWGSDQNGCYLVGEAGE